MEKLLEFIKKGYSIEFTYNPITKFIGIEVDDSKIWVGFYVSPEMFLDNKAFFEYLNIRVPIKLKKANEAFL